ncbi:MAG: hypothetical protein ACI4SG_00115 [Oligosphaeraceae bacterium]
MRQNTIFSFSRLALLSLCLFLANCPGAQTEASQEPRELLRKAMTEHGRFSGILPFADKETLLEWKSAQGEYRQLCLEDGFCLKKLVLQDDQGQDVITFLQDREGVFAGVEGKWRQLSGAYPLTLYDLLAEPFPEREWELAKFSLEEIRQEGKPLLKITMRLPEDLEALLEEERPELPLIVGRAARTLKDPAYARRPLTRVFFLQPGSLQILYRAHYNAHGKKIYEQRWEKQYNFRPVKERDFLRDGPVRDRKYFLKNSTLPEVHEMMAKRKGIVRRKKPGNPLRRILREQKVLLLLAAGALGISLAVILKLHQGKRHSRTPRDKSTQ